MTGANCFSVQVDSGGNKTYCTNGRNEAAVQYMNGEGRELTRYD